MICHNILYHYIIFYLCSYLSPSLSHYITIFQNDTTLEIASIKSVNLEFVRHSLLNRKLIKIDKRLETIQFEQGPKSKKVKNVLRILRVSAVVH